MEKVYQHATCTISADCAAGSSAGFLRPTKRLHADDWIDPCLLSIPKMAKLWLHNDPMTSSWDRVVEPLALRAWALQEQLLSMRVLHFGSGQLSWECHELATYQHCLLNFYELEHKHLPRLLSRMNIDTDVEIMSDPPLERWRSIVKNYSWRCLTKSEDKLIALSGMARVFRDFLGDEYLAGLWRSRILTELLWRVPYDARRPLEYRAPTWSWASLDSNIDHYPSLHPRWENGRDGCTVLEAQVVGLGSDTTGQVKGGHLRVLGIVRPCHLFLDDQENVQYVSLDMMNDAAACLSIDDIPAKHKAHFDLPDEVCGYDQLHILLVLRLNVNDCLGLILRKDEALGTFERVGVFEHRRSGLRSLSYFTRLMLTVYQIPNNFFNSPDPQERLKTLVSKEYEKAQDVDYLVPKSIEGLEKVQPQEIVIV
jgi:hypothetical protein